MKQLKAIGYSALVILLLCLTSTNGFLERKDIRRDNLRNNERLVNRNFFGDTWPPSSKILAERRDKAIADETFRDTSILNDRNSERRQRGNEERRQENSLDDLRNTIRRDDPRIHRFTDTDNRRNIKSFNRNRDHENRHEARSDRALLDRQVSRKRVADERRDLKFTSPNRNNRHLLVSARRIVDGRHSRITERERRIATSVTAQTDSRNEDSQLYRRETRQSNVRNSPTLQERRARTVVRIFNNNRHREDSRQSTRRILQDRLTTEDNRRSKDIYRQTDDRRRNDVRDNKIREIRSTSDLRQIGDVSSERRDRQISDNRQSTRLMLEDFREYRLRAEDNRRQVDDSRRSKMRDNKIREIRSSSESYQHKDVAFESQDRETSRNRQDNRQFTKLMLQDSRKYNLRTEDRRRFRQEDSQRNIMRDNKIRDTRSMSESPKRRDVAFERDDRRILNNRVTKQDNRQSTRRNLQNSRVETIDDRRLKDITSRQDRQMTEAARRASITSSRDENNNNRQQTPTERKMAISFSPDVTYLPTLKTVAWSRMVQALLLSFLVAQIVCNSSKTRKNLFSDLTNFVTVTKEKVL